MHDHSKVAAIALCLLLASCATDYDGYELNGVDGKFCVPTKYAVANVGWITDVVPESSGSFAFAGCWRLSQVAPPHCGFPPEVITGLVTSKERFRGWRWADFAEDAPIKRISVSADSSFSVDSDRGMVIVSRSVKNAEWYVWKVRKPISPQTPQFSDGDELIAICSGGGTRTSSGSEEKFDICNRRARGKSYSVEYSFESREKFPRGLEQLDKDVFRMVDSWRCEEKW